MNPLSWLESIVSWVLVTFHALLSAVFPADSGWAWGLSIVGLVVLIRLMLVPLFVRQIKSQRNMQIIQPQVKEIQRKYAGDRERQSQELMKLYRETGTNPLASCLPLLAQAPVFFALFRVLQGIAANKPYGVMTEELVAQGLTTRNWQVRIHPAGDRAVFDLETIKQDVRHPFRLQCEQWRLQKALRQRIARRATQTPSLQAPLRRVLDALAG